MEGANWREGLRRSPAGEELNPAAEPTAARPAATVILLRHGGKHAERGLEVCMVKRNSASRFMPDVWVFPGGAVEAEEGADDRAHRVCAIRELEEEAGVTLANPDELVAFSRWITPEAVRIRFDTWFYLAIAPPHSSPKPDGAETVDAAWVEPGAALERHEAGEMKLVFPTIWHLKALREYETAEQLIAAAREREVEPILPKILVEEGVVLMPGDPGYD